MILTKNDDFQRWISRLVYRWRTLRNAIRNANCTTQWIIEPLNAYCAATAMSQHAWSSVFSNSKHNLLFTRRRVFWNDISFFPIFGRGNQRGKHYESLSLFFFFFFPFSISFEVVQRLREKESFEIVSSNCKSEDESRAIFLRRKKAFVQIEEKKKKVNDDAWCEVGMSCTLLPSSLSSFFLDHFFSFTIKAFLPCGKIPHGLKAYQIWCENQKKNYGLLSLHIVLKEEWLDCTCFWYQPNLERAKSFLLLRTLFDLDSGKATRWT